MKLLRVGDAGAERPAVMLDDGTIIDVSSAVGEIDGAWLEGGGVARLAAQLAGGADGFPRVDPGTRIGPPVAKPGHIIAIGLNFADHAKEAGMDIPTEPVVFSKAPSSYSGPDDDVLIPRGSSKTDWEVELGVVIGRTAEYLPDEAAAMAHVAGLLHLQRRLRTRLPAPARSHLDQGQVGADLLPPPVPGWSRPTRSPTRRASPCSSRSTARCARPAARRR